MFIMRWRPDEYETLCRQAAQDPDCHYRNGQGNLSAYIRKCVLSHDRKTQGERIEKELRNMVFQIRKVGVNINQATKKINSGFGTAESAAALENGLEEIRGKLETLLRVLEGQYGGDEDSEH